MFGATQERLHPRCSFTNLKGKGELVAVVGKVVKVLSEQSKVLLECDPENKSTVTIQVPAKENIDEFKKIVYLEVRGSCISPRQVVMEEYTDFTDSFDLKSYNKMLSYAKEFKNLFA